jgi:23S rRNA G2445 N2-methylase RlmL
MAYIKLKIGNKEIEIRGSEAFLSRMESKIFQFMEKGEATAFIPIQEDLQVDNYGIVGQNSNNSIYQSDYVKEFIEKYNNFNTNIGKTL